MQIDYETGRILLEIIVLIVSLIAGFSSVYFANKSRKYVTMIKNSLQHMTSIGDVLAAIYEVRGCLWDIEYATETKDEDLWIQSMRNKRIQAGIIIAEGGSCPKIADQVIELGVKVFKLDTEQKVDFDKNGHSDFFVESGRLLGELREEQARLMKIAQGHLEDI